MTYELKEIRINSELLAPTILQAEGSIIYREAVKNGGTIRTFLFPKVTQQLSVIRCSKVRTSYLHQRRVMN